MGRDWHYITGSYGRGKLIKFVSVQDYLKFCEGIDKKFESGELRKECVFNFIKYVVMFDNDPFEGRLEVAGEYYIQYEKHGYLSIREKDGEIMIMDSGNQFEWPYQLKAYGEDEAKMAKRQTIDGYIYQLDEVFNEISRYSEPIYYTPYNWD